MKRAYRFMAKRKSRGKQKIAIGPIVGFLLGLMPGLSYAYTEAQNEASGAPGASFWTRFGNALMYAYAGITDDGTGKKIFSKDGLMIGTVPLIAMSALGYVAHKAAAKTGINRNIPWVSI